MSFYNYWISVFFFMSCNSLQGKPGISESIKESQTRGVFLNEYQSTKNIIKINDTLKISIDIAWLEKKWAYSTSPNNTAIITGYQLIVHTTEKLDENYSFSWTIGTSFERNFRNCGYKCLVTEFDSLPNERENWKIQQGRDLYNGAIHTIIGDLELHRKQENNKLLK